MHNQKPVMEPINPMRFFLVVSTTLVHAESSHFYDWTVSYAQLAPLGVDKQVVAFHKSNTSSFVFRFFFFLGLLIFDTNQNVFL